MNTMLEAYAYFNHEIKNNSLENLSGYSFVMDNIQCFCLQYINNDFITYEISHFGRTLFFFWTKQSIVDHKLASHVFIGLENTSPDNSVAGSAILSSVINKNLLPINCIRWVKRIDHSSDLGHIVVFDFDEFLTKLILKLSLKDTIIVLYAEPCIVQVFIESFLDW